jgi:putative heme-binding domain-containing protein
MQPRAWVALAATFFLGSAALAADTAPAAREDFSRHAIFANTAPRAATCAATTTSLPLQLRRGDRVCLIGNTLFERAQLFGQLSAILHAGFPDHELVIRNLAWSADEIDLGPRPENFADLDQHLTFCKADVIFAAYGFNESFAGPEGLPAFREKLTAFLRSLAGKAFNGRTGPRVVLVSPIPNENVAGVAAADRNNDSIAAYVAAMRDVAREEGVGFGDMFTPLRAAMGDPVNYLTINGCHLTQQGYGLFARELFRGCFAAEPPAISEPLRLACVDLDRQFFRRYRPLNTFYYTGGRNKEYGYLDFFPAMRSFDIMCATRDKRIWDIAHGRPVAEKPDDSNLPEMPAVNESRGANEWLPADKEQEAFKVDPRFAVNLFAGEERFPEIANPIQCRWDSRGRMWVSTSQAYPHVYPGMEPRDRLVILEDTDGDGTADKSKVFADDLHLPLSFEFGDGGVYVSEQPHLTFLKDTDGDDRADVHDVILSGFGTEDSHHSLHDFIWAPDGGLIFRESVFHHSQVETPYGPVRQQNSGWFHYQPRTHRLVGFGSYPSTNPWGVAFDAWGNHTASHPVFAEAFHAIDPPYPQQFPAPRGLQAYSGVCGQAFIDSPAFPADLQGGFVRARYKPTNRIEIHKWLEGDSGFNEQYVGDLIFSTNLSFIPVDCHFGPRGGLFIVDWYNPVKGHAQYSLRDSRRDRESGRIWRIVSTGHTPAAMPAIAGAPIDDVARLLGHGEFRIRYLATRELASRDPAAAAAAIDRWAAALDPASPRLLRDKAAAMWALSSIGAVRPSLLVELAAADDHHARAAAIRQLRFWHESLPDRHDLLEQAARDPSGLVRLEAAVTASWIGTPEALTAVLEICKQPLRGHLAYAANCALESRLLRRHWEHDPASPVPGLLKKASRTLQIAEPKPTAAERSFDQQPGVSEVQVSCEPERMLFTNRQFTVAPGQPVKLLFTNPDATDHNLVIVKPGALAEVGMAANDMAKDPKNATGDFVPDTKRDLIIAATPMVGPTRKSLVHVLRFTAPTEPGVYPYVCTFPGHWIVMNGQMVVARNAAEAEELLAACQPTIVKAWTLDDFPAVSTATDEATLTRGMHAFAKAQCTQCHVAGGHGVNLGPILVETVKKYRGRNLLEQILDPSKVIHEQYRTMQYVLDSGKVLSGLVRHENADAITLVTNLAAPDQTTTIPRADIEETTPVKVSAMPAGLLNVLTRDEILALVSFVEAGDSLPPSLRHAAPHAQPAAEKPAVPAAADTGYFQLRDGLGNARFAFERGRQGRVVFLGGSITAGGGWRDQVCDWLRKRFPATEFDFINAGIGSLGSVPHSFRLERDVLAKGPVDLLFVEAAVNDTANGTDRDRMRRAMEGIVRHIRRANPLTDIVHMHFVMPEHMENYTAGIVPPAIEEHERVAAAYGNPSLNLSREVTDRIAAGEFTWDGDFKNLHPSTFGHRLYAESIGRMLEAAWAGSAPAVATPHQMPDKPVDAAAYDRGRLGPVSAATVIKGFALVERWRPTDGTKTRPGFVDIPTIVGLSPGDEFEVDFDGTAIGLFIASGPDAGLIESSIDGGPYRPSVTFTRWSSGLHLPWAVMLADGLPPGHHTVRVRIAADRHPNSKGTAVRAFHLLLNDVQ